MASAERSELSSAATTLACALLCLCIVYWNISMSRWSLATTSEVTAMDAHDAARELCRSLHAPAGTVRISVWVQSGKTTLMAWVDPRVAGQIKIPSHFEGFRVDIRRKLPIQAN